MIEFRTYPFYLAVICLLVSAISLSSCDPDNTAKPNQGEAFVKYYGGISNQQGFDVRVTTDGGYVLFGSTSSFGNGNQDFFLVKVDNEGNELWTQTYVSPTGSDSTEIGKAVRLTTDGGYVMIGNAVRDTINKIMIVKTDASGNQQWSKIIRQSVNSSEFAGDIQVTSTQGGYVITGSTDKVDVSKPGHTAEFDLLDLYTAKLNDNGDVEWERTDGFPESDFGVSLEIMGNAIVTLGTGTLTSPAPSKKSFLMAKYNFVGGPPFDQKNYGSVSQVLDLANSFPTTDGGLALVGSMKLPSGDNQIVFQKLDQFLNEDGNLVAFTNNGSESGFSVTELDDGNFAITGTRVVSTDNEDILLILTDPLGNLFADTAVFGESGKDAAGSVVNLGSNGFIISGTVDVGTNTMGALIKTNSRGEIIPE